MNDNILDDFTLDKEKKILHPIFKIYLFVLFAKLIMELGVQSYTRFSFSFTYSSLCLLFGLFVFYIFVQKIFHQTNASNRTIHILFICFFLGTIGQASIFFFIAQIPHISLFHILTYHLMWVGAVVLPLHYYAKTYNKISAFSFFRYPLWIAAPFYAVGVWFKTMSWVYASELLVISTLLFLFTGSIAFVSHQIKQKGVNFLSDFLTCLMSFSFTVGILFKFQSWPYADELIVSFLILLFIRLISFFVPRKFKNR